MPSEPRRTRGGARPLPPAAGSSGWPEPPSWLIVDVKGWVVILGSLLFVWTQDAGETAVCEADGEAWHCERRENALLLRGLGLGGASVSGPGRFTAIEVRPARHLRARGQAAVLMSGEVEVFRWPVQPSIEEAEANATAARAWVREPRATLEVRGPAPTFYRLLAWAVTGVAVLALGGAIYDRLRPR